jgi:hypothetical protein
MHQDEKAEKALKAGSGAGFVINNRERPIA